MTQVRTLTVAAEEADLRLDRWFKRHFPELGHGRLEKLLRTGQVRVDGKRARANARLVGGEVVRVPPLGDEDASVRQECERRRSVEARDDDVGVEAFRLLGRSRLSAAAPVRTSRAAEEYGPKPVRIKFGSSEYFDFVSKHPQAAPWLALGQKVQFVLNGTVYEIYE
jgi:hypothetical protein